MSSNDRFDPNDLEQLRSINQAERRAASRRVARRLQSNNPQVAWNELARLLRGLMPIIIGNLKILDKPDDFASAFITERLRELVQEALIRIWRGRMHYDPDRCDLGAWMLCVARSAWSKVLAERLEKSPKMLIEGVGESRTEKATEKPWRHSTGAPP